MRALKRGDKETIYQFDCGPSFWIRWVSIVIISLIIIFSSISLLWAKPLRQPFNKAEQNILVDSMRSETGYTLKYLQSIFMDSRLNKISILTERNVYNKENPRDYKDFLSQYSVRTAYHFTKKWRTILSKASKKFQVDKEVLVAIMQVESSLGHFTGRYPIISVFSSLIVEENKAEQELGRKSNLSEDEKYRLMRLRHKGLWARAELVALLKIARTTHYTPFALKGSFAGAFGIPQFLPSSYLKWGFDSDKNGTINLYLMPDAIYSTANYLKSHGWKKGLTHKNKKRIILKYNNSSIYAKTIISLAEKIKFYGKKRQGPGWSDVYLPEKNVQVTLLTD